MYTVLRNLFVQAPLPTKWAGLAGQPEPPRYKRSRAGWLGHVTQPPPVTGARYSVPIVPSTRVIPALRFLPSLVSHCPRRHGPCPLKTRPGTQRRCRLVNQRRLIDPRQIEALTNSSHPGQPHHHHHHHHQPSPADQQPPCPTQPWLPSSSSGPGCTAPSSLSPTGTPMLLATDSSASGKLLAPAVRQVDVTPPSTPAPARLLNPVPLSQCRRSHPRREPRGSNRPQASRRQGALRPYLPHPPRRPVQHLPQAATKAGVDQARGGHTLPCAPHQARRGRAEGEGCSRHPDRPQEPLKDRLAHV